MTKVTIICGDVTKLPVWGKFHAILCDPPYHLTTINSLGGSQYAKQASGTDNSTRGFMGKKWDGGNVAFNVDVWRSLLDLLHPGGFGMAFGGTRTYHRMACAIEDAGAVLHPMIGWLFGSGFPKATRIDTQIDKAAGIAVKHGKAHPAFAPRGVGYREAEFSENGHDDKAKHEPVSDLAKAWAGHRYGRQALKPAIEPICCFQRTYEGRPIDCITETGAGSLWIDGARVGTEEVKTNGRGSMRGTTPIVPQSPDFVGDLHAGRWPANLILQHSPECGDECADGCAVRALGEQSGERPTGDLTGQPRKENHIYNSAGSTIGRPRYHKGDQGTAARFFTQVSWRLDQSEPFWYQPKAGRKERDAGLDGFERKANDFQRESSGLNQDRPGREGRKPMVSPRNPHPTCKPIELNKHLSTLLLPPPEYAPRRLLVPFGGVGSEVIGAMLAGWDEIVMIEQSLEYCEIAQARVAWWQEQVQQQGTTEVKALLKKRKVAKKPPQTPLL